MGIFQSLSHEGWNCKVCPRSGALKIGVSSTWKASFAPAEIANGELLWSHLGGEIKHEGCLHLRESNELSFREVDFVRPWSIPVLTACRTQESISAKDSY